ncbi:MAG: ChpI protein [Planctomycetota bacterium]
MKTAVSIPDRTFQAAERAAKKLRVSRSRLYAVAVDEYVRRIDRSNLTERFNKALKGQDSRLDPVLARIQAHSLSREPW